MIVLDEEKSNHLRCTYINSFVNVDSPYYVKNILCKKEFCDGLCYSGYLWDCLIKPSIISERNAEQFLNSKTQIFIMWDIHSCERIMIPNYWKFPKSHILHTDVWSETFKSKLPEDIYLFDDTFSWTVIFTHEADDQNNRFCLFIDKSYR